MRAHAAHALRPQRGFRGCVAAAGKSFKRRDEKRREEGKKDSLSPFVLDDLREKKPLLKTYTKKQSVRKLALDLTASSAPSFEGLRAVYRALGVAKGLEKAPSLQEALSGSKTKETRTKTKTEPEANGAAETEAHQEAKKEEKKKKPRDPALAARLQALRDASDQAAYDACVADLTEGERRASSRSGHGLSLSLAASAPAAGLALAASAGTGYAAGFVAARALFPDEGKHPAARHIGGLAGLVAALAVEAGLVVVRAVRAEREERLRMKGLFSSSNSSSSLLPLPKITRRLTEAELAAEAEVAAAVVAGAATAARAGAGERAAEAAARAAAELEAEDSAAATTAATAATAGEAKKQR